MVTFLHTADWQIGMTRRFLGDEAQARFSAARIDAIRRLGEVAVAQEAEFVVVCGDVFEANQLSGQTVRRTLDALAAVPVPVFLLPGNHDPLDVLTIYRTPLFLQQCPAHVQVLDTSGPVRVREGLELVAAPWRSKHPGTDLVAEALALAGPADGTVRIVVGHGAVDVLDPDRHNAASIALAPLETALAQGRIHYVALGDRHSRTSVGSSGAVWYAGAPEVTSPQEQLPGDVLVVRLGGDAAAPTVEPHHVGQWSFLSWSRELRGADDVSALDAELAALPAKERTVVRLALRGALGLAEGARLEEVLHGHGEVLAALYRWDRHTDLRVLADGAELRALGLGGFLATAAEEIREMAVSAPSDLGSGAEEAQDFAEPAPDADNAEMAPLSVHAGAESGTGADLLDWEFDPERSDDLDSATEALALLYRLTGQGRR